MTLNKNTTEKLFYKISEVAKMFSVNISAVRFWEKEFDILKPKKNKKGNRLFTPKDIKNIQIIYHLLKDRGFTVEGAKKKLKENKSDTIDNIEIVSHLKDIRGFLVSLRGSL
jgi:DNA-binding transcriptional MerR regulator